MFLQNLRAKVGARLNGDSEAGFTLIELLVVMLILGILAAIAIPAFFNQRDKAHDAQAKAMVRSAETAAETYATEHGGTYTGMEPEKLHKIEETITIEEGGTEPESVFLSEAAPTESGGGYTVKVTDPSTGNWFSIAREDESGVPTFDCGPEEETGGCPAEGAWNK